MCKLNVKILVDGFTEDSEEFKSLIVQTLKKNV